MDKKILMLAIILLLFSAACSEKNTDDKGYDISESRDAALTYLIQNKSLETQPILVKEDTLRCPNCYKYDYEYLVDSEKIDGMKDLVKAEITVIENEVVDAVFAQSLSIRSYDDCIKAGYELLEPDCVGCSNHCITPEGEIFTEGILPDENNMGCIDLCGNGECEEVVCMGSGCPCPESKESCPEDCS